MEFTYPTPAQQINNPQPWRKHILLISLIVVTVISLSTTIFLLVRHPNFSTALPSTATQKGLISGTFDINGVIPNGASIVIKRVNAASSSDNATFPQNFPAVDQGTWSLDNINNGKSYTVTADIVVQGNVIAQSDPIEVTAPATDQTLTLNISGTQSSGATANSAVISGTIRVNGYIPSGSTITVKGRILGKNTYSIIASNLPGAASQFMSYASATAGQTYEIVGVLLDSKGNQIGISPTLGVTAPAMNEQLSINSTAVPPATPTPAPTTQVATTAPTQQITPTPAPTPAMISGSINFNGVAPANSRIVILERVFNSQQYQVAVNNVTPQNSATWQWTGAQVGTWYNIVAVLKQTQSDGTDQDIALSETESVATPATNVVLTINSGIYLSAPNGTISASCGNLVNNVWGGQMSYQSVPGAQSYWLQVGTSDGSNNVYSSVQNDNGQSNQTASVNFNNGVTYYARYAYATTQNASQPQFSPFSSTTQFVCNQ
jgi:hypothetical protein